MKKIARFPFPVWVLPVALVLWTIRPHSLLADDTSLLREEGAKAFLFIILDTSQSMVSFDMNGDPVMTYEDSRLSSARKALYEALVDVPDIHLGIVSFGGKDELRVTGKHWLYKVEDSLSNEGAIGSLPIDYPALGAGLYLGPIFSEASGSCEDPLTDPADLSTYSKLGADSRTTTEQWYREGGRTYRLQWQNPSAVDKLGKNRLKVSLRVERLSSGNSACDGPSFTGPASQAVLDLVMAGPRLIMSSPAPAILAAEQKKNEATNEGRWNYQAVRGDYSCGPDKPFSAQGMEPNDDTSSDLACVGTDCNHWLFPTRSDPSGFAELGEGDAIFWHYEEDRRTEVLQRLNPLHPSGEEFGVAALLADEPDPTTGYYPWRNVAERTYLGGGNSPLSDALLDIRCWLSGPGRSKCRNNNLPFTQGFNALASDGDLEWDLCRQTYFMIVSDGENNCAGENPSADIAGFFRDLGTRTWYFNVEPRNSGAVQSIIRPGQGEAITVGSEGELTEKMNEVVGLIMERQRTFASAAIPSVSHDVEDKVVITSFRPFNGTGYWEGHTTAFLKPLPLDPLGRPDLEHENFLWDTAEQMLTQAKLDVAAATTTSDLRLGSGLDRRRVYFPMAADGGAVPRVRQLLGPPDGLTVPSGMSIDDVLVDQWKGLGIVGDTYTLGGLVANETAEYLRALEIFRSTYGIKEMEVTDEDGLTINVEYLQGDIFHSNPQVIGGPGNARWFEENLLGYRDFALKQLRRRKLLLACSNGGFCHGFDAGVFRYEDREFDSGTGTELFAVAARQTLPVIADLAEGTTHRWGMDGTPRIMDVFMDPSHNGTPNVKDREWRTLAVVGGRRGTQSFLALDLTDPDPMKEVTNDFGIVLGYVPETESVLPQNADYPGIPWEFEDAEDEDGNGIPDLGQAWSTPNLGRIRVIEGEKEVDKFVAAFSGGLEPGGNWLYMVDLETGKAIYKRQLDSAAPAEVAAVDADRDGYWDRIYAGTVGGFIYRADIGAPQGLESTPYGSRVTDVTWEPRAIFNTGGRPIYFAPQVIFVGRLGRYALAFGTGNRDNLWTKATPGGERFYLFVDESRLEDPADLPLVESRFYQVLPDDDPHGEDFLTTREVGHRGWYLVLTEEENERLLSAALAFPSVVTYSTFVPNLDASTSGNGSNASSVCTRSGVSRNYIQFTLSGDGTLSGEDGATARYQEVDDFITDPYVEWRSTDQVQEGYEDPLDYDPVLRGLWEAIADQMPRDCEISPNDGFSVNAIRSDTGVATLAVIPQCKRMVNWLRE